VEANYVIQQSQEERSLIRDIATINTTAGTGNAAAQTNYSKLLRFQSDIAG